MLLLPVIPFRLAVLQQVAVPVPEAEVRAVLVLGAGELAGPVHQEVVVVAQPEVAVPVQEVGLVLAEQLAVLVLVEFAVLFLRVVFPDCFFGAIHFFYFHFQLPLV
jgi:hypothetical protein